MGDGKIARSYRTDNKPDAPLENLSSVARAIKQGHDDRRHKAIDAE
jgi:hypothetical protein